MLIRDRTTRRRLRKIDACIIAADRRLAAVAADLGKLFLTEEHLRADLVDLAAGRPPACDVSMIWPTVATITGKAEPIGLNIPGRPDDWAATVRTSEAALAIVLAAADDHRAKLHEAEERRQRAIAAFMTATSEALAAGAIVPSAEDLEFTGDLEQRGVAFAERVSQALRAPP